MPEPREARSTVSVVVVTSDSEKYIRACLQSICEQSAVQSEVIVVDNASSDDTCRVVSAAFPSATLLQMDKNRWYTAAANRGAACARGDYLLFLNPDAALTADALPRLLGHMESEPAVAAAGPRLVYPDGRPQASAFTYPTLLMTWLEFFPHPGRLLDSPLNGRLAPRGTEPISIDHPLGACILVRRDAWNDVGSFDEGFVHYCEEVDWCMRAKRRGWRIAHVPTAIVIHHGAASTVRRPGASILHLYASRDRLHRKHRGPAFRAAARFITRLGLTRERRRLLRQLRFGRPADGAADRIAAIDRILRRAAA